MTNSYGFVLQPDDDEKLDADLGEHSDDGDGDEKSSDERQDGDPLQAALDRITKLEARDAKRDQQVVTALGRLDTLSKRLENATSTKEVETLKRSMGTQISSLQDLVGSVADGFDGLDESFVDANAKSRVRQAREKARGAAEEMSVEERVAAAVQQALAGMLPNKEAQAKRAEEAAALEEELVAEIEDEGLDPDDSELFDWKQVSDLFTTKGAAAVRRYVRTQIKGAASKAESTDKARDEKKTVATKSPAGAGASKSGLDRLEDLGINEGIEALRKAGVINI